MSTSTASSSSSRAPELATITGSTTSGSGCSSSQSATVSMIAREKSIPVFAASIPMSPATASSCARTNHVGTSWTAIDLARVLRRERDDRRHAVDSRRGERLQVGLDPCAASGIGARDRDAAWNQRLPSPA